LDRLAALALVLAIACGPAAAVPTSAPSATASLTPTQTVAVHGTPAPTTGATHVPRVGGCTSPQFTTRQMLDRYFSLTTSGDVPAALDCFAKIYRDKGDIEFSASRWVSAGALSSLKISYVDAVNGCDRYATQFQFANPDPLFPDGFGIFYTVGPESGVMRIFDGGTGLARADLVTTVCR
jgi:hypothetical protein